MISVSKGIQNSTITLHYEVRVNDVLTDPTALTLTVYSPDGSVLIPATSVLDKKVAVGIYEPGLTASQSSTSGRHRVVWTVTIDTDVLQDEEWLDIVPREMIYATIDDLRQYAPKLAFSSTTTPTENQVNQIIIDVANIINAALDSIGYARPVTDETSLEILRVLNAKGALKDIIPAMFPTMTEMGEHFAEGYENLLKQLRKGELFSKDAVRTNRNRPASYATDNTDDATTESIFEKGQTW